MMSPDKAIACTWSVGPPYRCKRCGTIRSRPVSRHCRADISCTHRGECVRHAKIGCGSTYTVANVYSCELHRLCILDGTIRQEPERSMIAVCSSCDDRTPVSAKLKDTAHDARDHADAGQHEGEPVGLQDESQ